MQRLFDSLQLAAGSWESRGSQLKGDQGPADVIPAKHDTTPKSLFGKEERKTHGHEPLPLLPWMLQSIFTLHPQTILYAHAGRPPLGFARRTLQENLIWLGICNPAIEDKRALADRPLARSNALIG